jgi:hypothetical protein
MLHARCSIVSSDTVVLRIKLGEVCISRYSLDLHTQMVVSSNTVASAPADDALYRCIAPLQVFLSATLANATEFAAWVAGLHKQPCHVVYTDFRPTPLQHYAFPVGGNGLYAVHNLTNLTATSVQCPLARRWSLSGRAVIWH